jgi:uncharacterized membrane protein
MSSEASNAPGCTRFLARITGIGYIVVLLAGLIGLMIENQGEALPQHFWPALAAVAVILVGPLALYLSLRPAEAAASAETITIKRTEYASIARVNQTLVKENAQLNQQLGFYQGLVKEGQRAATNGVYQLCLEIRGARPEAGLTHKLYIPFRREFQAQHNQGSSYHCRPGGRHVWNRWRDQW